MTCSTQINSDEFQIKKSILWKLAVYLSNHVIWNQLCEKQGLDADSIIRPVIWAGDIQKENHRKCFFYEYRLRMCIRILVRKIIWYRLLLRQQFYSEYSKYQDIKIFLLLHFVIYFQQQEIERAWSVMY